MTSNRSWYDPRVPSASQCVLRYVLERRAAQTPDRVYLRFEDGAEWSFAQTLAAARKAASAFTRLGVKRGDTVVSWQPNGPDAIRAWFGLNLLGAVYVPINTSYRGHLLEHVVANSQATLMVAHEGLVDRLDGIDLCRLRDLVVMSRGNDEPVLPSIGSLKACPGSVLVDATDDLPELDEPLQPWELQTIIYTSGTTGPSKGVQSSYLHLYSASVDPATYLDETDRYLVHLPLFHVGGTVPVYGMLMRGGSAAIVSTFKLDDFWSQVRFHQATFCILLAGMATLLKKRPPSPQDRQHTLRHVSMIPLIEPPDEFRERFGCTVYTAFNMTEISSPLTSGPQPQVLGSCGSPREGIQVRIVDANDCEVEPGATGELLVRSDRPWALNHGYFRNDEATVRAWRNGWFHTGDGFRVDSSGHYHFVDRMKDAMRRRGENISSFEVESEVNSHPDIQETAAVAVPNALGDDDVLVVVVPVAGRSIDPAALVEYLVPRMPHFMVPRYVRVIEQLPKTPTQKVQKIELRREGVTADTWDREAAGVFVRHQAL